jgi:hypothetical protein
MSVLTMDMSSYEFQKDDASTKEYDEEVLCSGWIPTLALQQSLPPDWENKSAIPEDMVSVDAEIFLQKMCSYQR